MNLGIFRESLLPYSETFIAEQAVSLRRYQPTLVGLKRLPNTATLPVPSLVLPEIGGLPPGGLRAFKLLGRVPFTWEKTLREQQFSLIHAHFGLDALWSLPLVRKLKLPFIVTFHGYDVGFLQKPYTRTYHYYQLRRPSIFRQANKIIAVSEFLKLRLQKLGCPEEKILTHYIGIDLTKFASKKTKKERIILSVGRLIERKGVRELIQVMPEVRKRYPDVRLVVVGGGPLEAELKTEADRLGVHVEFTGPQTPEQVRGWMNRAALFCLPSQDEAFGLVYAEAQAMELPVVAYNHGGVPEAVKDGETGFLVPVGDKRALTQYLITLLENEELRNKMGLAGKHHVQTHFDIQRQSQILEGIYDRILSE